MKRRNSKRACYECGEVSHVIADCPKKGNDNDEKKRDKSKKHKRKYPGQAHIGEKWDSNDSDSNSDSEGVANSPSAPLHRQSHFLVT